MINYSYNNIKQDANQYLLHITSHDWFEFQKNYLKSNIDIDSSDDELYTKEIVNECRVPYNNNIQFIESPLEIYNLLINSIDLQGEKFREIHKNWVHRMKKIDYLEKKFNPLQWQENHLLTIDFIKNCFSISNLLNKIKKNSKICSSKTLIIRIYLHWLKKENYFDTTFISSFNPCLNRNCGKKNYASCLCVCSNKSNLPGILYESKP